MLALRLIFSPLTVLGLAFFCEPDPALAQRPLGVDVSSYQGSGIDWVSVRNSGISFAWAKATEGLTVNDSAFVANENNAAAAGVFVGAYHFAHPELHLGAAGADQEATHFWSVAGPYITADGSRLMPMLDVESSLGTNTTYTAATLSAWVNEWCSNIVSRAAASGVAIKPVVYTYTSYATSWLDATATIWPLWMAQYPASPDPQAGAPSSTSPWSSWAVWQYGDTGTVPGISGNCDVDVFNGTAATLSTLVVGNPVAPYFIWKPVNHRAGDTGQSVSFSATAAGSAPLNYQWTLNGVKIAGATNATINIVNTTTNQSGNYALVVTNFAGSVTSSPLSLLVYPVQATVFSDSFDSNTAANWTVNKSSGDNAVAFSFDYSALGIPSAPHSTGGTTLGVRMQANLSLGAVAAVSLSPLNQNFSGDYRLHFDSWINVNGPFPGGGTGSTEFLTAGIGTSGTRVEWTGNASADGFYFSANGDGGSSDTVATTADYNAYSGATVQSAATGDYWAGTTASARGNGNVYYTTAFPEQVAPALQQANFPQQSGGLNPGTFGLAWHDVIISRRGSIVDWVVDGIRMATISNVTFTASNVFVGFWDPFASLSSNNVINFGLVDNVRVEVAIIAPSILIQPAYTAVKLSGNATFAVSATGQPAPSYQWLFNGVPISNANNSTYTRTNVQLSQFGNYSVIVSNVAGSVTSSNANLALIPPLPAQFQQINVQPDGGLHLVFNGDPSWAYTVETSTNLLDWSALTNLTSASGVFDFVTGSISNDAAGFYRARSGP